MLERLKNIQILQFNCVLVLELLEILGSAEFTISNKSNLIGKNLVPVETEFVLGFGLLPRFGPDRH